MDGCRRGDLHGVRTAKTKRGQTTHRAPRVDWVASFDVEDKRRTWSANIKTKLGQRKRRGKGKVETRRRGRPDSVLR